MLYLQLMENHNFIYVRHPDSGEMTIHSRIEEPNLIRYRREGYVSELDGHRLCLYRHDGTLYLGFDEKQFALGDSSAVQLDDLAEGRRRLTLLQQNEVVFSLTYQRPKIWPPLDVDPTAGIEEEFYDFGLFVHNVVNDPRRRREIWLNAG